jgi:hypothetical protein
MSVLPPPTRSFRITSSTATPCIYFPALVTNHFHEPKLRLRMYCSGHTTMADGRVFYTGGARYSDISSPWEMEWGEF